MQTETTEITAIPKKRRNSYSDEVKEAVLIKYPRCRDEAEKLALAAELNILGPDGKPSLSRLYNLASRISATGQSGALQAVELYDPCNDRARLWLREDPQASLPFSPRDDEELRRHFPVTLALDELVDGSYREHWLPIEEIARKLGRSETAVSRRARQLTTSVLSTGKWKSDSEPPRSTRPLRRVPQLWDWKKVSAFLGVAPALTPTGNPATDPLVKVRAAYRSLSAKLKRKPTADELAAICLGDADLAALVCSEERVTELWDELSMMTPPSSDEPFGYDVEKAHTTRQLHVAAAYKNGKISIEEGRTLLRSLQLLRALELNGLVLSPCSDRDGKACITVVSTLSLMRALQLDEPIGKGVGERPLWQQLLEDCDADEFFLLDLRESLALIRREGLLIGRGGWERWRWMSHGGVSLCPHVPSSLGLVPDKYDFEMSAVLER